MQKTIYYLLLIITVLTIITISFLSIYISFTKPREISNYISLDNITNIKVSTRIPEKHNEKIEFNMSEEEVLEFITLIKSTCVTRVFGDNDYDTTGYTLTFSYLDGTTTMISYREYVMLNNKWYKVYGYSFDYIYKTYSYKAAMNSI